MSDSTKTYLALGDSYTSGTSIAFPVNFPNKLADGIKAVTGKGITVKIVAQNAWRTDDLQRGIKRSDLDDTYDLISLLIGVNNQYQGLPLADFEKDFRRLLDTAITYSGKDQNRIFVLSLPNYGYTPYGAEKKEQITTELAMFNALTQSICVELGIDYYNITDISLEAENNSDYRASDNLHPSALQYAAWVSSIIDRVIAKLN